MNARVIKSKNYKALLNGAVTNANLGTAQYFGFIQGTPAGTNIFKAWDGTEYPYLQATTSQDSFSKAEDMAHAMAHKLLNVSGSLYAGVGGEDVTENSYTLDESIGYVSRNLKTAPNGQWWVATITNSGDAPITFNQVHLTASAYFNTVKNTAQWTNARILLYTIVFDEDVVVAPNTSFTFNATI